MPEPSAAPDFLLRINKGKTRSILTLKRDCYSDIYQIPCDAASRIQNYFKKIH